MRLGFHGGAAARYRLPALPTRAVASGKLYSGNPVWVSCCMTRTMLSNQSALVPAPRVTPKTDGSHALEPILDGMVAIEEFEAALLAAFGTAERVVAEALFEQLVNILHADPTKAVDA